jgi:hypothetical protein
MHYCHIRTIKCPLKKMKLINHQELINFYRNLVTFNPGLTGVIKEL